MFKIAWSKNGTPNTLSGTSATMDISDITSTIFNQVLMMGMSLGSENNNYRLGSTSIDTGSNYANRYSADGGADGTGTSETFARFGQNSTNGTNCFTIGYFINIATEEKLGISFDVRQNTAGAANAPNRSEQVQKWVNTSNQFDNLQTRVESGTMATDSNTSLLGTD